MEINYSLELDKIIRSLNKRASLLLHSCCAPCSSYVLEYLSEFFDITILYYNPNIYPTEEYHRRLDEQRMLIDTMPFKGVVSLVESTFEPSEFYDAVKGYENEIEGAERCFLCYELRLRHAVEYAKINSFDFFATTLSISPHKNAKKLNEIGEMLAIEYGITHLPSDFKKRNGYKRSLELSAEFSLYRQDYCGCEFSYQNKCTKS